MLHGSVAPDVQDFPILYVDDEDANLLTFRYTMGDQFHVLTSRNGEQALQILEQEPVAVLLCDQCMPGMTGVEVCTHARSIRPDAVRIIMTAYADLGDAIDAINRGQVTRYLRKPWNHDELCSTLVGAVEMVRLQRVMRRMQSRMLQGADALAIDGLRRELASQLCDPLASLTIATEHLSDLLSAAMQAEAERVQQLLQHARLAQGDIARSLQLLQELSTRLTAGQRVEDRKQAPPTDVARAVRATASALERLLGHGGQLRVVLEAAPLVRMAHSQVGQLLVHLVTNAVQAGSLTPEVPLTITISVLAEGANAQIRVEDNGPGIAAELRERVFDPFFGTGTGAGLGLSLARHMVSEAGGTVELQAIEPHGTRAVVWLPNLARTSEPRVL